jgi:hypothetical protein
MLNLQAIMKGFSVEESSSSLHPVMCPTSAGFGVEMEDYNWYI